MKNTQETPIYYCVKWYDNDTGESGRFGHTLDPDYFKTTIAVGKAMYYDREYEIVKVDSTHIPL